MTPAWAYRTTAGRPALSLPGLGDIVYSGEDLQTVYRELGL